MDNIKRICLWSGPRNISTALMYSFAQRADTKVFDEPLYAYYLRHHPEAHAYHPDSEIILQTIENNGDLVIKDMLTNKERPVLFFKHMTHHLLGLNRSFMKKTINVILTRNPKDMLPSFDKVISNPTIDDVGYALHVELIAYFKKYDIPFAVLDSKKVLLHPEKTLQKLCEFAAIDFDKNMLMWQAQKRQEDGVWAKHWYSNVHKSTGFLNYKPKDTSFPKHLNSLLKECQPYYNQLLEYSI